MKTTLTILLATGLAGFMALAADQAPAAGGGRGAGGPGGGGRGGFQGRGGGMMGLDEQQRQLLQEALQKDGDKLRALEDQLRAAQKELLQATLASTYDEKVIRTKAEAVAKIQVEITVLRAKALASVAVTMKPEQKEQLLQSPFGAAILSGGGGPVQRGGPGGGPGRGGQGGFAPGAGDQAPRAR